MILGARFFSIFFLEGFVIIRWLALGCCDHKHLCIDGHSFWEDILDGGAWKSSVCCGCITIRQDTTGIVIGMNNIYDKSVFLGL